MPQDRDVTIQPEELRALLLATTIYYDPGTRFRRAKALGDIIAKVLYLTPTRKAKKTKIQEQAAKMVGVPRLAESDVIDALNLLKDSGIIAKSKSDGWLLKPEWVQRTTENIESNRAQADLLLNRYFGDGLDMSLLRPWFWRITASFCGRYSENAVKVLEGKMSGRQLQLEAFLDTDLPQLSEELGLGDHIERLKSGYRALLADINTPAVYTQLWAIAQVAFSARLITASIGADPIVSLKFRGAKFLLDTNVLFISSLEASELAPALAELIRSLGSLGASLHMIYPTREEYIGVVAHKRKVIPQAAGEFNADILDEARDTFYDTAVARGCKTQDDFIRFFDAIAAPPTNFENVPIVFEDTPDTVLAIQSGHRDQQLQNQIASAFSSKWAGRRKPQASLRHDAALNAVCESMRARGENAWVLSVDGTVQLVSVRRAGAANDPVWVSLQSLIQILALLGTGPGHDPSNFAPLLARLIEAEVRPRENGAYDIADLLALNDDCERLQELSKEEIVSFARQLTRIKLTSNNPRDISETIVAVQRQLQRPRIEGVDALRKANERAVEAEQGAALATKGKVAAKTAAEDTSYGARLPIEYAKVVFFMVLKVVVYGGVLYWSISSWLAGHDILGSLFAAAALTLIIDVIRGISKQFTKAESKARSYAEKFVQQKIEAAIK